MTNEEALSWAIDVDAVRAERIAQGLPATITDPEALALIASVLHTAPTRRELAA